MTEVVVDINVFGRFCFLVDKIKRQIKENRDCAVMTFDDFGPPLSVLPPKILFRNLLKLTYIRYTPLPQLQFDVTYCHPIEKLTEIGRHRRIEAIDCDPSID